MASASALPLASSIRAIHERAGRSVLQARSLRLESTVVLLYDDETIICWRLCQPFVQQ